jgi:hypothetical protein
VIVRCGLALILLLAGCTDGQRLSAIVDPPPLGGPGGSNFAILLRGQASSAALTGATFYEVMNASAIVPDDHAKARRYLASGIALSDQLCGNWFQQLGRAQAEANANADLVSGAGALSSTIMGLAGAAAPAVGALAGATGFVQSSIRSEQANFIVAPDVSVVQSLLNTSRQTKAAELLQLGQDYDYETATIKLTGYSNMCSHLAIRRLVTASVSRDEDCQTNPSACILRVQTDAQRTAMSNGALGVRNPDPLVREPPFVAPPVDILATPQTGVDKVDTASRALSTQFGQTVTPNDMIALYAVLVAKPALMTAHYKSILAADQLADKVNALTVAGQKQVTDAMAPVGEMLATTVARREAAAKRSADAAAASPPPLAVVPAHP